MLYSPGHTVLRSLLDQGMEAELDKQPKIDLNIDQLTFEQRGFRLFRTTYMQIFFSIHTVEYNKCIFLPYDFLINIFFSLAHSIVRIQYLIHRAYSIWGN